MADNDLALDLDTPLARGGAGDDEWLRRVALLPNTPEAQRQAIIDREPLSGASFSDKALAQSEYLHNLLAKDPAREYSNFLPVSYDSAGHPHWAWPGAAHDMAESLLGTVEAPGRALMGQPQKVTPLEMALNLAGAGFGMAAPKGALGMFAGRRAATADLDALAQAKRLAAAGAPAEEVLRRTGWFNSPQGGWKFELSDKGSSFDIGPLMARRNASMEDIRKYGMVADLQAYLQHPELYKAYPELARYKTFMTAEGVMPEGFTGGFHPELKRFYLNPSEISSNDMAKQIILHEAQHAIQKKEGWPLGGSPKQFTLQGPGPALATDAMGQYHRLAGEVEARNVERRANFGALTQRMTPPWVTQDVPYSLQLGGVQDRLGLVPRRVRGSDGEDYRLEPVDYDPFAKGP